MKKDEKYWGHYEGRYLPVHIGDTLSHGRYKIVRMLDWCYSSITWLAKDTEYTSFLLPSLFLTISLPES